jgi:[ribosomal protein S5]-alanine N-acetyltransferase
VNKRHSLSTKRLDLQPAEPRHAELTWPYLADDRMWEFFPSLRPPTLEALRQRYERWSRDMPYLGAPERWENWICVRRQDGTVTGEAQATYAGSTVYVAYGIFVPFQRRGFAAEAIREVLRHARDIHGARLAKAEMAAANRASVALAEALGFARVTTRRDSDPGHGYRGDEFVYQLPLS